MRLSLAFTIKTILSHEKMQAKALHEPGRMLAYKLFIT